LVKNKIRAEGGLEPLPPPGRFFPTLKSRARRTEKPTTRHPPHPPPAVTMMPGHTRPAQRTYPLRTPRTTGKRGPQRYKHWEPRRVTPLSFPWENPPHPSPPTRQQLSAHKTKANVQDTRTGKTYLADQNAPVELHPLPLPRLHP